MDIQMTFHKYSGAGNSFLVADGRLSAPVGVSEVRALCSREGVDGLMILSASSAFDFKMEYFNPDGSTGMMCGNGGRCIVAFAAFLGITPARGASYEFEAPDGIHTASILSDDGSRSIVRLSMIDPEGIRKMHCEGFEGIFMNTGARHFVTFVDDVEKVDVEASGALLRNSPTFRPEGTNVDFVQVTGPGEICVRTFEKGVEDETLACGTGIVASAVASRLRGDSSCLFTVHARTDTLSVEFTPDLREVFLIGPAERLSYHLLPEELLTV